MTDNIISDLEIIEKLFVSREMFYYMTTTLNKYSPWGFDKHKVLVSFGMTFFLIFEYF